MESTARFPLQTFDPAQQKAVVERRLPHWSQAGTISFITLRTHDSMPKSVVRKWHADRDRWLRQREIDPAAPRWRAQLERLPAALVEEFERRFSERWHELLDECHGRCALRRPELREFVVESLQHFNGDRYELTDFVVMPNHLHALVAFPCEDDMLRQCDSWKHFSAVQINRSLASRGRFWQQDGFDHLVRSQAEFDRLRAYVADNPAKARLPVGEFTHYAKAL